MNSCKLYLNGESVGNVKWQRTGSNIIIWANCMFERNYIYRVFIRADQCRELYLGVMLPKNGEFVIQKTLPLGKADILLHEEHENLRGEIFRAIPGEKRALPLPFAFSELQLEKRFDFVNDPVLKRCLEGQSGAMTTQFEREYYFVFPLRVNEESSLIPFYCITTPVDVNGSSYGAFKMDATGRIKQIIPAT